MPACRQSRRAHTAAGQSLLYVYAISGTSLIVGGYVATIGIIQAVASPKFFAALSVDYQLFPSYVDVFLRIQGDGVVLIVSMI